MAVALLTAACSPASGPAATTLSATGLVIAASGPDASSVTTFTLRTNDGRTLDFVVGKLDLTGGGLPSPHLREHMAGSTTTTVYYQVENGRNVATKFIDADL